MMFSQQISIEKRRSLRYISPMMVNELEILKTLLGSLVQNSGVAVGPGDDCAVLDFAGGKLTLQAYPGWKIEPAGAPFF